MRCWAGGRQRGRRGCFEPSPFSRNCYGASVGMSVAGLFSGIGGFEAAFAAAGFQTNVLVEVDRAARAVLKARFPNVDIRCDVQDVNELDPETTIITAGFPCQNLSMAGDKAGIKGPKSGVVHKLFSLIAGCNPAIVVIENVYFMLQLDSGRAMDWLASQFEALGYRWAYRVVDTMGFGIPQRRRRVYMVGSRETDPRGVLFADDEGEACEASPSLDKPVGFYWTEGRSGIGLTVDGIPPLKVGSGARYPVASRGFVYGRGSAHAKFVCLREAAGLRSRLDSGGRW